MPGYRLPLRVEEIDARYICVHCKLLLKNPFLTGCGHLYCHSCIELLIRNPKETPYCKIDGMKLERAFEDLNTRAEIMQFVVMCPFHSQGCKWVGKVQHFEFHQGMCAFFSGTSHNMDFNRAYQSEHVVQDSKHQLVDSSPSDRDNMKDGAGADVGSISDDSITLVKRCPFHLQGCPWVGEVKHLQMHVFREHESVYEGVDFRNDHSYEDQPSNASFTEQDSGERQLQTRINRLEEKEVEVERRFDDQNMESSLIFGGLSRRMELIERILASQNVTRAELEQYLKLHQFLNYESQLVWKITEFDRKRSEAVNGQKLSFDSPCFYTSRYGYKMCARIYLNGNGMGRGTHISLFFVVMRGEYDSILRWPFRQRVTFMLLDQDDVGHVIDAFRPDPNSSSFQRPRGETNIASGCPTFVSIEELNNHAYVREDTIFFKIIVDVSD